LQTLPGLVTIYYQGKQFRPNDKEALEICRKSIENNRKIYDEGGSKVDWGGQVHILGLSVYIPHPTRFVATS